VEEQELVDQLVQLLQQMEQLILAVEEAVQRQEVVPLRVQLYKREMVVMEQ
tara:strand:+ start:769 stop:921 length:153 start_codon:yes stop_codon:yes gene_type:complete